MIDNETYRSLGRYGYAVEMVAEGEHYDYLAKITKKE
jgi:hypothetical protein